jgi:hypothetical protein
MIWNFIAESMVPPTGLPAVMSCVQTCIFGCSRLIRNIKATYQSDIRPANQAGAALIFLVAIGETDVTAR